MIIDLGKGQYIELNSIDTQKFTISEQPSGALFIKPNRNNNTIKKDAIHISTMDKGEICLDCKPR